MTRRSAKDKEYFFQDWFTARLKAVAGNAWDQGGRNSYPDFVLTDYPEGYELKGLTYPGRTTFDSNSRYPTAIHREREIYYVFGRYHDQSSTTLVLADLLICHGRFINAHIENPKNKSFLGYGSYGDILIRDRKMYTAPVPFWITDGTVGKVTLILPSETGVDKQVECVGELVRNEVDQLVVGYAFDLTTNILTPRFAPNPNAGRAYRFRAFRVKGAAGGPVTMSVTNSVMTDAAVAVDREDE